LVRGRDPFRARAVASPLPAACDSAIARDSRVVPSSP